MEFLEELKDLKISLDEIIAATNNFDNNNLIGNGGFGKVYKGTLSRYKDGSMFAFKRLDRRFGQGNPEFFKEITMLSRYTHQNLITLTGFCNEGIEKILVYEYASRGSLDQYLHVSDLTWKQRLKICIAAAKGLKYLHDPRETYQRVIHCDIKSANILIDENWNVKLSDFGLSKISPAKQPQTFLFSTVAGTIGYCDPMYFKTGYLTKESDVYSFGVVLFEVLCGKLCFEYESGQVLNLVSMWKQHKEQDKISEITLQSLMPEIDRNSLKVFSDIAYQCTLEKSPKARPTMVAVVEQLEIALNYQSIFEEAELQKKKLEAAFSLQERYEEVERFRLHEEIMKTALSPVIYRSKHELNLLLSEGLLLNKGRKWFSLNKKREHCEMISLAECLIPNPSGSHPDRFSFAHCSRFPEGSYLTIDGHFNTHVRAELLSPKITYTVNLVFKFMYQNRKALKEPTYSAFKYKLDGETTSSISYLSDGREDGWLMAELYQFTSDSRNLDLKILFEGSAFSFVVEAIEFRPMEKVDEEILEDEKVDIHPISESGKYWTQKLPNDYKSIIKGSAAYNGHRRTKEELYFLLCEGLLINNAEEWFYLTKNGKKCHMLQAKTILSRNQWTWTSLPESRFKEVAYDPPLSFSIICTVKAQLLTRKTTYASCLVYKLPEDDARFEAPVKVKSRDMHSKYWDVTDFWYIYLRSPRTPVITTTENSYNALGRPKIKGLPLTRIDGWMEVQIWEFSTDSTDKTMAMQFDLMSTLFKRLDGLIVQGIDFKPI